MATYYADFDLGSGNNDGTSWTHAWKTPEDVIAGSNGTAPNDNDTVYCCGQADQVGAAVTNTLGGTQTTGMVKWIGVNPSTHLNDGTRCTISAGGNNIAVWVQTGDYNYFENFRFTGSGNNDAFEGAGGYCGFVNCSFDTCGGRGFLNTGDRHVFIRCVAYGNVDGFYLSYGMKMYFCCARDNSGDGINGQGTSGGYNMYIGVVCYDNGDKGFETINGSQHLFNCAIDNNTAKGLAGGAAQLNSILGCRITNQSGAGDIGLDFDNGIFLYGWNAFDGNTDHIADDTYCISVSHNGTETNSQLNEAGAGGGDTNQGYVSLVEGAEDYSTDYTSGTDPHLRRTAITIPTS